MRIYEFTSPLNETTDDNHFIAKIAQTSNIDQSLVGRKGLKVGDLIDKNKIKPQTQEQAHLLMIPVEFVDNWLKSDALPGQRVSGLGGSKIIIVRQRLQSIDHIRSTLAHELQHSLDHIKSLGRYNRGWGRGPYSKVRGSQHEMPYSDRPLEWNARLTQELYDKIYLAIKSSPLWKNGLKTPKSKALFIKMKIKDFWRDRYGSNWDRQFKNKEKDPNFRRWYSRIYKTLDNMIDDILNDKDLSKSTIEYDPLYLGKRTQARLDKEAARFKKVKEIRKQQISKFWQNNTLGLKNLDQAKDAGYNGIAFIDREMQESWRDQAELYSSMEVYKLVKNPMKQAYGKVYLIKNERDGLKSWGVDQNGNKHALPAFPLVK